MDMAIEPRLLIILFMEIATIRWNVLRTVWKPFSVTLRLLLRLPVYKLLLTSVWGLYLTTTALLTW